MQAAFIVLPTVAVAVATWLFAWRQTRYAEVRPCEELQRLRNHAMWLEQRLDTARREHWDREMIRSLSAQLGIACQQHTEARLRLHALSLSTTR